MHLRTTSRVSVFVRRAAAALALCTLPAASELAAQNHSPKDEKSGAEKSAGDAVKPPLAIDLGPGQPALTIPRDEELEYSVVLDIPVLGHAEVGTVTITSKVEAFHPTGLLALQPDPEPELEQAIVSSHATGSYAVYTADQEISTRILPQAWPHFLHRNIQSGTENRQRELMIGMRDGQSTSMNRNDGHCRGCEDRAHFLKPNWVWQKEAHCTGCRRAEHRVWGAYKTKPVPEGTVDMVTAVMVARTMIEQGKPSASFVLLDKDRLWNVALSRGRKVRRKVHAGTFDTVEVVLKTTRGEPLRRHDKEGEFEGLFGLHGAITIWMHPESGVPVAVTGTVPAGPLEVDVAIELTNFRGTPETFQTSGK